MTTAAPYYSNIATPGIIGPTEQDYLRMKAIKQRWDYYRGKFPAPLKDEKGEPDSKCVIDNRLASIINTSVDYLLKDGITIDVSAAGADAQKKLDAAWGSAAKMMTFFIESAQSGAVGGHMYWRVLPPRTPDNLSQYARFVAIDPQRVSVITDPDDVNVVTCYIVEYTLNLKNGQTLIKRQVFERLDENPAATEGEDVLEHWSITNYQSLGGPGALEQVGESVDWVQTFEPIIHNKNLPNPHECYGLTDIEDDIIALQLALNLAQTNTAKLSFLYSHPVYWSDAVDAESIDISPSGVVVIGPGATLNAIEAHAAITDLLAWIEAILEDMDERSAVPQIATGRIKEAKFGQLSGTAIKLMFMRLIAKTLLKRLLYGQTYAKACQIHLFFAGVQNAFQIQPVINWPDILPNDEAAFWSSVPQMQAIGISDDTIGTAAGFDMAKEREKKAQQDQEAMQNFQRGQGLPPDALGFMRQPLPNDPNQ